MVKIKYPFYLFFLVIALHTQAQQQDTLAITTQKETPKVKTTQANTYDPLAPSKASFYSAVIPGLGQAFNKKYWKIPIVYAGIGTSLYFHFSNRNEYNRFRDAYKRRLAGFSDDEFQGVTNETLIRAQRTSRRNMDVSLAVAIGFYLLNIVDANVDAHLRQYNISEDLSMTPHFKYNNNQSNTIYGLSLTYKIK